MKGKQQNEGRELQKGKKKRINIRTVYANLVINPNTLQKIDYF